MNEALIESRAQAARLAQTLHRRASRLRAVAEVNRAISSSLDVSNVLGEIAKAVASIMEAPIAIFWIYDSAVQQFRIRAFSDDAISAGFPVESFRIGQGGIGTVAELREPVNVHDMTTDSRFIQPEWWTDKGLSSFYGTPVIHNDQLLAVLALVGEKPFEFDTDDIDLLDILVSHAAVSLHNALTYEELQVEASEIAFHDKALREYSSDLSTSNTELSKEIEQRVKAEEALLKAEKEERHLAELGRIISSSLEIKEVYEQFAQHLSDLISFDRISIGLVNHERGTITSTYLAGEEVEGRYTGHEYPIDDSLADAIREKKAQIHQPDNIDEIPDSILSKKLGLKSLIRSPLIADDEVIGFLHVRSKEANAYNDEDLDLIHRVCDQIAGAIANAELHKSLRREAQEREFLSEIGHIINSSFDITKVYNALASQVGKLIEFDRIGITEIDYSEQAIKRTYVWGEEVSERSLAGNNPIQGTQAGKVVESRTSSIVHVDGEDDITNSFPGLLPLAKAGFRSFLSVPLISNDIVIGTLQFRSKKKSVYSSDAQQLAERIASQIAGAISNAQLYSQVRREAFERQVLSEIGKIISSSLDIDEVYERFAEQVRKLIPFDRIGIAFPNPDGQTFSNAYQFGTYVPGRVHREDSPLEGSTTLHTVETRQSLIVHPDSSGELESIFPGLIPGYEAGLRSFLTVPLISKGEAIGALNLRSLTPKLYTERDIELAQNIANQIAGTIANARLYSVQKAAEEQIKYSLREKEVLLKEIHHRVKNNLQVIYSLLALQSDYTDDWKTSEMFRENQNRIRSMSLIHEKLYQSNELGKVDFSSYLKSLVTELSRSYNVSPIQISFAVEVNGVSFDLDTAMPCGLIVNELVSNSLKYAFPENRTGEIKIVLSPAGDELEKYTLVVSDNGIGLPENFDVQNSDSLGLELVDTLATQLSGSLELDISQGTEFKITFSQIRQSLKKEG